MRTPGEVRAYVDGMRAGALRVRIATEGQFRGDVRAAEEFVKNIAAFLERDLYLHPEPTARITPLPDDLED